MTHSTAASPMSDLKGKTAIITGAAGFIGRAAASVLAARGARIVAVDHPSADTSALVEALPQGSELHLLTADATIESEVEAYVNKTLELTGRIDIFFNNAGIEGPQTPIADYPVDAYRKVLDVNVVGVFLGLQKVMPVMIRQKAGSIINTSSIAGLVGAPDMAGYITSKHAVMGLTKVAALEAAPHGVRVNSVNPGFINSRMLNDITQNLGAPMTSMADLVPMGRLGTPDEIARAVAFLASDESSYMNGTSMVLDGGVVVA